jgi:hypothetical protein
MSPAQKAALAQFDPEAGLPFVDIGNLYVTIGASSSPSALEGLSLEQIGSDLSNPASPVAQAVDGTANYLIAAMCQMTSETGPAVCSSPTTTRALTALGSGVAPGVGTSTSQPAPQPPTNAPMSVWRRWSDEMHSYLEQQVAHTVFRANPGCVVTSAEVTGTRLTKAALGIPAGATVWAITETGRCRPGTEGVR